MARSEPGLIIRRGIESGYLSEGGKKERIGGGGAIIGHGVKKASEEDPEDRRVYVYDMRCLGTARAEEDES